MYSAECDHNILLFLFFICYFFIKIEKNINCIVIFNMSLVTLLQYSAIQPIVQVVIDNVKREFDKWVASNFYEYLTIDLEKEYNMRFAMIEELSIILNDKLIKVGDGIDNVKYSLEYGEYDINIDSGIIHV